jgi:hypothetical protein
VWVWVWVWVWMWVWVWVCVCVCVYAWCESVVDQVQVTGESVLTYADVC